MIDYQTQRSKYTKGVRRLAELFEKGQVSDLTAQILIKLVDLEISKTMLDLQATIRDLEKFEKQFGMSTKEFFENYQSGKTDDNMDTIEWASLAQMANQIRERLVLLTDENIEELKKNAQTNYQKVLDYVLEKNKELYERLAST